MKPRQPGAIILVAELCNKIKLKRIPGGLRGIVAAYITEKGAEYVKRNILYANEKAKDRYSTYLQRALQNDWGGIWAEEKQIEMDFNAKQEEQLKKEEQRRLAEEEARKQREAELTRQSGIFIEKAKNLPGMFKKMLYEKALSKVPESLPANIARNNAIIQYTKLVLESLNDDGAGLMNDLINVDGVVEAVCEFESLDALE